MKKTILGQLFGIAVLLGCGMPALAASGIGPQSSAVDARVLWQEFQDHKQEAENTYRARRVTVSGVVVETGMSIYATPNVRLSDRENGDIYVVCVLPRADFAKLAAFSKGKRATLTGVYRHNNNGPLVIKECRAEE